MTDLETRTAPEAVKEPAKRWRNWWRCEPNDDLICNDCHVWTKSGASGVISDHCRSFPSKDVAESLAYQELLQTKWRPEETEYLGAFPEGQTP